MADDAEAKARIRAKKAAALKEIVQRERAVTKTREMFQVGLS